MADDSHLRVQGELTRIRRPKACYVVGCVLVLFVFIAIILIIAVHLNIVERLTTSLMLRTHIMCGAFGMLGAAVAAIRKYYRTLITESTATAEGHATPPVIWDLGWIFYYMTRPLLGAILGALSFTLSFVGFQVLATQPDIQISEEGRYLLLALAFVSGFAVSQVLDRLNSVAKEMFKANKDT